MTSNSDKLRSLILAALMVFSVFAGTVALTGSAAAAGNDSGVDPEPRKATHYVDSNDNAVLEVAFTEQLDGSSLQSDSVVTVTLENGTSVEAINGTSGVNSFTLRSGTPSDGQLVINTPTVYNNVANVTIENVEDVNDDQIDEGTIDVTFAPETADVSTTNDIDAYRGSNVSLIDGEELDGAFKIEGDDVSYSATRGSGDSSEVYVWNTTGRELGDYYVNDSGTGASGSVIVTLEDLGLTIESDETTFEDDENVTATVETNDFDRDVRVDIVDDSGDEVASQVVNIDSDGEATANFSYQDTGNYTFEAEDVNTGVTAESGEFEVVDAGDAETSFAQSVYEQERGDVVNISVEYSNTDTATVQIGDVEDDNYAITAEVVDDDGDGVAYVEFNSFNAGSTSTVLTAGDDDTEINNPSQTGSFDGENSPLGADILSASSYELSTGAGGYSGSGTLADDDEDNVATLSLNERSTENAQIWTAPEDTYDDLTSSNTEASDVSDFVEAGNLTQTGTVADGDTIVVQVDASGLEGALDQDDLTNSYQTASNDSTLFEFLIEEEEAGANADPDSVNVSSLSDVGVLYNADADTHYVVLNSTEVAQGVGGYEDGKSYVANFTVYGDKDNNDLADSNESVEDDFSVENQDLDFDTNDNDEVEVGAAASQEVTGTTNLAPGSELTIRMRSDTDGSPFLKQPETTVQEDGSFSATADFSDQSPGATFNVQARLGGSNVDSEVDGVVTEATATPEPTETGTPADGTDTPEPTDTPDMDTDTPDMDTDTATEPAGTTTGDSGPGFTAAIALIALVAAALLAVRRDN